MKLRNEFITQNVEQTQIMVSTDENLFPGMARSNRTAAFLIDLLKAGTSREEMEKKMAEKYHISPDVASADVKKILDILYKINAIED